MDFHQRITKNLTKLNDTDKRILDYILKRSEHFSNEKLSTISESLFISSNSVVRFAQKLQYSGFSEMKFSIVASAKEGNSQRTAESKYREKGEVTIQNLIKTLDINHERKIKEAVDSIVAANKIVFFALGITKNYAKSFIQRLQAFNKVCVLSSDRDNALMLAKNIDSEYLAFFISLFGQTDILIQSATYLKQKNVKMITLTGMSPTYIQELGDVNLFAHSEVNMVDAIDMSSRLSVEFVLDSLINELFNRYHTEQEDVLS